MQLGTAALDALQLAITLMLPAVGASLAIGLLLAFFEVVTHGQDPSLSFVPRLLGVAAVIWLGHELMSAELVRFTGRVFEQIALVR